MLVGLIDGYGYISITNSGRNYIKVELVIALHIRDIELLRYIQSTLGIGRIYLY